MCRALERSGAERAVLPLRVPISVIFAHRSAPAPRPPAPRSALLRSIFSTSAHRSARVNFWTAPFRFPFAHTNSLHHCKSEHNFNTSYTTSEYMLVDSTRLSCSDKLQHIYKFLPFPGELQEKVPLCPCVWAPVIMMNCEITSCY